MPDDYKEQAQFDEGSTLHEFYNPILYKLVVEILRKSGSPEFPKKFRDWKQTTWNSLMKIIMLAVQHA